MIHHDIRQRLEEREELLSPLAAKSRLAKGRLRLKPLRSDFDRGSEERPD